MAATSRVLEQLGEALTVRREPIRPTATTAVVTLPLNAIVEPPGERKIRRDRADADLDKLMESLREHGLLHPVGVRSLPDGRFELVYGSRRVAAARWLGWTSIAASLHLDLAEDDAMVAGLAENLHRKDLSRHELTIALRQLASLHRPGTQIGGYSTGGHAAIQPPPRQPGSAGDLARRLGVDVSTITRLAALGRDEQLLGLVEDGELGLTAASHVARVPLELRRPVLEQVLQEHLSAGATHQHVNRVLRERRVPATVPTGSAPAPATSLHRLKVALGMLASIELQDVGEGHRVVLDNIAAQLERLRAEAACGSAATLGLG